MTWNEYLALLVEEVRWTGVLVWAAFEERGGEKEALGLEGDLARYLAHAAPEDVVDRVGDRVWFRCTRNFVRAAQRMSAATDFEWGDALWGWDGVGHIVARAG